MKAVYSDAHARHDPQHFLVRGKLRRTHERPERVERLAAAARADGHELLAPPDYGLAPIAAVHTPAYLRFLETAHARWQLLDDPSDEVRPNIHPFPGQPASYPDSVLGQAGYHLGDGACPIGPHTWEAAYGSAQVAAHAAQLVTDGERAAYALCRPPGHHAYAERANGFCYLNNTAIAAQALRAVHARVAILDIDVHHGNGTQGIFYRRRDVLTVSLHRDTRDFTPFFTGHAHERGEADGEGYNLNLPLPRGTGDTAYLSALDEACARIRAFAPGALVVALGLDAHEHDPYQSLAITTAGFFRITAEIARLGLPTVLVQEGGYLSASLGENLSSALRGFLSAA
ncbi:histone deacetylase family protein [Burkholderia oklahomensis]|uniref:Histone deacetylase domain protein n=1 Tax=Burkholderia oklahomensis TaxID=342113 RepID=A0AAI8B7A4_9BURK|nr:histone deacetylase family protein [Burkholderia oklahomensis]AIO66977.1 histone deacetylase domain protein [Burkholderia oklahomensis]AJX31437.1 histone deacetylase domain protein [Burkholderia oklahomensis C6786]AOI42820.1 acetylpolyamine aminohydrolase [Burkholderia oklahomensis EO147]AOI46309.1 acetylpolyamine aminohydrolase [Burkholderia oklahomensis C6786]KUY53933.1 acetylpolyamine aminohydrolase [Burkholderia oklahomensis C6786]